MEPEPSAVGGPSFELGSGTTELAEPATTGPADPKLATTLSPKPEAPARPPAAPPRGKPAPAEPALQIPPILLEGDKPQWTGMGPDEKFALGPAPTAGPRHREAAELPEAYGTGRMLLVARDPHWLYAHWDLAPEQQRQYNALSADHHLVVRVQPDSIAGHPATEIHVHPESRSWFIHVERAATRYSAELGYYPESRQWVTVAASAPVVTPPDTVSADKTLRFATIPLEVPLREFGASGEQAGLQVLGKVGRDASPRRPLPSQHGRLGEASLPATREGASPEPTRRAVAPPFALQQERALAAVFKRYRILHEPASSLEVSELSHGRAEGEAPSPPIKFPPPPGGPIPSISSPLGGEEQPAKPFWLNLNAELVLYGATEPAARLTIGGQPIALQPDGTFSFRFSLPDGNYELSVSAHSTAGDCREAALKFTRRTNRQGEIGTVPPDPVLHPPNVTKI